MRVRPRSHVRAQSASINPSRAGQNAQPPAATRPAAGTIMEAMTLWLMRCG